jgi:hypothetical protein
VEYNPCRLVSESIPRMWLPKECETENTVDDLLTVRPGSIIRGSGAGGQPTPLNEPFDVQRGMAMLQYLAGEQESRTGITRLNQGLDADTLNKTATGTALMQAQGQQFEEFIARNFAEAMSRLFQCPSGIKDPTVIDLKQASLLLLDAGSRAAKTSPLEASLSLSDDG